MTTNKARRVAGRHYKSLRFIAGCDASDHRQTLIHPFDTDSCEDRLLENLTRFAIWQLVPRVHDVQFALLITVVSGFGGILGAVSTAAILLAKARRFKLAGWLTLAFGILGLALSVPQVVMAQQAFDENRQPFIDALAYVGFTSVWSTVLVILGVLLLFKRVGKAS